MAKKFRSRRKTVRRSIPAPDKDVSNEPSIQDVAKTISTQIIERDSQIQQNEPSTLGHALRIMNDADTESTDVSLVIKAKEIGLGLSLSGLAEIQAHRVMKLHKALELVENRLFTPEILNRLKDSDLIDLYRLMASNLESSGKFIAGISKTLNFDMLKESLRDLEVTNKDSPIINSHESQAMAGKLLRRLYEEVEEDFDN